MKAWIRAAVIGTLVIAGCDSGGGGGGTPGNGGATAGTTGVAGSAAGSSGAAGAAGAAAGAGGSTTGAAGSTPGTAGSTSGAGGSTTGAAGTGGPAGAGGRGGSAGAGAAAGAGAGGRGGGAGAAGRGGAAGGAVAGATGSAGAGAGDAYVSGVMVTVHPNTTTILNVSWTQAMAAETTRLEFSFAGSTVMSSHTKPGTTGAHRDVVLGVPASTAVTVRIVSRQGGVDYKTRDYTGTTGAIPTGMPVPMILAYDAAGASPERYMFGSVENSTGGCTNRNCYFDGLFWVYIMDRQGRIVWYYSDASSNAATGFQRIARDGEYIWIERSRTGTRGVTKMTLDRQYFQQINGINIGDAIDVTTDGSLLYENNGDLHERNKAGTDRMIWSCHTAFGASYNCYSNAVNWNPADDTVLLSFPEPNTVAQINRATGALVATYGDRAGSYTFMPTTWSLEWQHFPNISAAGTLMVSSHLPMFPEGSAAGPMQHAFIEFEIDRTNKRLVEKWSYSAGTEWPLSRGMAIKLPNGNVLGNYGTGGAIREITPDKRTVFHVKFDVATGSDYANKMVGHNVLVDDLYLMNGGGPPP